MKKKCLPYSIIVLFCFILYANTLTHEYAIDDAIVITQNEFTKQGIKGISNILSYDTFMGFFGKKKNLLAGGRYRPFSLITFAIEYQFFGENPFVSHLGNILLYILTGILIFLLLKKYFPFTESSYAWLPLPLAVTLLYLAHPVHTEVIANIKGRDEILSMLGSLLALYLTLTYLQQRKTWHIILAALSLFVGLMSKENAVTFLAIIPLAVYFFMPAKLNESMKPMFFLLLSFVIFFIIRRMVLGPMNTKIPDELLNNPFLHASTGEKYATIIYTLGLYVKLLLYPHPLTNDYYPFHIPIIGFSDWRVLVSLALYISMGIYAVLRLPKKNIYSFSILYYLITLSIVSNIFFAIGTFMNERFLYMPSLGFALAMVFLLLPKRTKAIWINNIKVLVFFIMLSAFTAKTIDRNRYWKNDFTIFTHDVKISPNSVKSNCSAGGKLLEQSALVEDENIKKEYQRLSLQYLEKAVSLYPTYKDALLLLGNAHYEIHKNYRKTMFYYLRLLRLNPDYDLVYNNIERIFSGYDTIDYKIYIYEEMYKINPRRFEVNYNLGNLYGKYKNDLEKSIHFLTRALQIKPDEAKALKDLGVAYAMSGKIQESRALFEKALQYTPDDPDVYFNLGISYSQTGDIEKANAFIRKGHEVKNKQKEQ